MKGYVPLNISGGSLARMSEEGISEGIVLARERTWTEVSVEQLGGCYNLDEFDIFLECFDIVVSSFLPFKGPKALPKRDLTSDLTLWTGFNFKMGSHVKRESVEPIIHVDHPLLVGNDFDCFQQPGTVSLKNRFEIFHGWTGKWLSAHPSQERVMDFITETSALRRQGITL